MPKNRTGESACRQSVLVAGGGEVEIQASFPAGVIGTTAENLKATAGGEHHEWPDSQIYPTFASIDREEGLSA